MHITSKRLTGVRGKNFEAHIEYNDSLIAIHLPTVDKLNKSDFLEMKYMLEDWDLFFKQCGYKETYVAVGPDDLKVKKLVDKLGFEYIADNQNLSIYRYIGE